MYTRKLFVFPSDVSCDGKLKLRSLLNYFQDTAGLAVQNIEGTTSELLSRGYAWVLTRYEIAIKKFPSLDEEFSITTYHDPSHGYNTLRNFHVKQNDNEIITAKSSWLLLDVKAKRPVKPAAHLPEIISRDTEKISQDFREIPEPNEIISSVNFPVKFHDLDYNAHVNNAAYFEWVWDNSPQKFSRISALFRSGAKLGEKITLNFSENGVCEILRPDVKKPCVTFLLERE